MKKEINGWVYVQNDGDYRGSVFHTTFPDNFSDIKAAKATLSIEMPERKIEISESEFNQMVREIEFDSGLTVVNGNHISARTRWYQKLFKKSEN